MNLAANGKLIGIPLQDGTFNFTIYVKDNSGNSGSIAMSLTVDRKRWAAYLSDAVTQGRYLPYLLDYTKSPPVVTDLSSVVGAKCSADLPVFSPNGKKAIFIAKHGTSCEQSWLYVVDISTSTVGTPKRVDYNSGISARWNWSPDSRWIAYTEITDAPTSTGNRFFVDLSGDSPAVPVAFDTNTLIHNDFNLWVSPTILTWLDDQYRITTISRNALGTGWNTKQVSDYQCDFGPIFATAPNGRIACSKVVEFTRPAEMRVYDLGSNTFFGPYNGIFSKDLTLAVDYYDGRTGGTSTNGQLVRVTSPGGTPINSTLGARLSAVWANTSNSVIVGPTLTLDAITYRNIMSSGYSTETLTGSVGLTNVVFSPDDSWVGWGSSAIVAVSISPIGERTTISTALPSGGTLTPNIQFSPNSKFVSWTGQMSTASAIEAYVVDLSTGTPGTVRKVNGVLGNGKSVNTTGFTADSDYFYYRVGTEPNATMYISSVIGNAPLGQLLLTNYSSAVFQP
jgi:hypothetical protein